MIRYLNKGPLKNVQPDLRILEFPPWGTRNMWTYSTSGMADITKSDMLEIHLFAPNRDEIHIETLGVISHYHLTGNALNLHHTVNLGRPWLPESSCTHGYLSLPYLDGPNLETGSYNNIEVRFLWLLPVTTAEVKYKKENGAEALEALFDNPKFNYLDPFRPSVLEVMEDN